MLNLSMPSNVELQSRFAPRTNDTIVSTRPPWLIKREISSTRRDGQQDPIDEVGAIWHVGAVIAWRPKRRSSVRTRPEHVMFCSGLLVSM
jgi:hypothetical protein